MNNFLLTAFGVAIALTGSLGGEASAAPPEKAPQATAVYGYVLNPKDQSKPAFYSFSLTSPAEIEMVYLPTNTNNGEGGGAMTPNGYLVMTKPTSFSSYLYGYLYNTNPWEYNKAISGKDNGTNSSEPFFANDVTWNPVDNMLYGCYKKPGSSYNEIAKMNISTSQFQRTSVGGSYSGQRLLNGIAANSQGALFGIAANGTLYSINRNTGSATEIGPTGLTNVTTATFNLRNDVLYAATWSATAGSAAIYTINTETGEANKLYDLPNNEHIEALAFELPLSAEKAPDAPTNFRLNFPEGSMSGQFVFDTPSKLYDETPATGDVEYIIYIDNTTTKITGTTQYGKSDVSVDYEFAQSGKHDFMVALKNDAGESAQAVIKQQWIGCGVPDSPSGFKATVDGTNVTLSWNAVTQGDYNTRTYNAFFDPEEVTYTVICTSDNDRVVVAETKELSCIDSLGEIADMVKKSYRVKAHFRTNTSSLSSYAYATIGTSFGIPYLEDFATSANFSDFYVKKDLSFYHNSSGYIYCSTSSYSSYNGWVFTPKLRLKAGNTYVFKMQYWCRENKGATLEVKAGKEPDKEQMLLPVVDLFTVSGYQGDANYVIANVTVSEDGEYSFGINLIADKISEYVYLDNIEVYFPTAAVPKSPEFSAVCGEDGELKSYLTVTAPIEGADEGKIMSLDKLTVKRQGEIVFEQENPEPGKTYTFEESFEEAGTLNYSASATNGFGESGPATATTFVGFNLPAAPVNIRVEESPVGTLTLTWDAPELDPEGNDLKDKNLTYTVINAETGAVLQNYLEDTSYTHRVVTETSEGRYVQYAVFATNNAGDSEAASTDLLFAGRPAESGWFDSFSNGKAARSWAVTAEGDGWQISDDTESIVAYDADHGMLLYYGETESKAVYTTIPQAIPSEGERYLSLYYNTLSEDTRARLALEVTDTEDNARLLVKEIVPAGLPDNSWTRTSIALNAFAGKTVVVSLRAEGEGMAAVDMIRMAEEAITDIALLSVEYPEAVESDTDILIKATITNLGDTLPADWILLLENEEGDTVTLFEGTETELPIDEAVTVELPVFSFSALDKEEHPFKLRLETDNDADIDNGVRHLTVIHLLNKDLPTATSPEAYKDMETGYAVISWEAPSEAEDLTGFNIWRGNELVASLPATDTGYTDSEVEEAMGTVYAITAVYSGNRQSLPVYVTVDKEVSEVGLIHIDGEDDAEYYDLQGFRLKSPAQGQIVIRRSGDKIEKVKI